MARASGKSSLRLALVGLVALAAGGDVAAGQSSAGEVSAEFVPAQVSVVSDEVRGIIDRHEEAEGAEHGEEGAEHGEEGEHGEHGEHHHEISTAMKTTSYLLIGFLVANFLMFRLVNYRDGNIRSYTWKMISATVSIYLAVVLDTALKNVLVDLMLGEHPNEETKEYVRMAVALVMFCGWFTALNFFSNYLKDTSGGYYVHAVVTIGGHVTAFAGIGICEALLETSKSDFMPWVYLVVVFLGLFAARALARWVRHRMFGKRKEAPKPKEGDEDTKLLTPTKGEAASSKAKTKDKASPGKDAAPESPGSPTNAALTLEGEEWREMIVEGEDEACAIIQSFMLTKVMMSLVFRGEAEEELVKHTWTEIGILLAIETVVLILLSLSTYAVKLLDKKKVPGEKESIEDEIIKERVVENVQGTLAMTMSWLSLVLFFWVSMALFEHVEHHFIEVISAAILTVFAIVGILVLDLVADRLEDPKKKEKKLKRQEEKAKTSITAKIYGLFKKAPPPLQPEPLLTEAKTFAEALGDSKNLEKAIRAIINGISLSVGLAWEHAFHAASSTIVETNSTLEANPILARILIATFSYVLMFPVWLDFLVGMAKKTDEDHEALIEQSEKQNKIN